MENDWIKKIMDDVKVIRTEGQLREHLDTCSNLTAEDKDRMVALAKAEKVGYFLKKTPCVLKVIENKSNFSNFRRLSTVDDQVTKVTQGESQCKKVQ